MTCIPTVTSSSSFMGVIAPRSQTPASGGLWRPLEAYRNLWKPLEASGGLWKPIETS